MSKSTKQTMGNRGSERVTCSRSEIHSNNKTNKDLFHLLLFEIKITYEAEIKINSKVSTQRIKVPGCFDENYTHSGFNFCGLPGRQNVHIIIKNS